MRRGWRSAFRSHYNVEERLMEMMIWIRLTNVDERMLTVGEVKERSEVRW